jgi:hypothetical protein
MLSELMKETESCVSKAFLDPAEVLPHLIFYPQLQLEKGL